MKLLDTPWMELSCEYLITLKEKGLGDQEFYNEYSFICYEMYKAKHPESIQEIINIQAKNILSIEVLR